MLSLSQKALTSCQCHGASMTSMTPVRTLRSVWERGYLKDLYHRRVMAGAEPVLHRSAYPNWNYSAEVFALSHRLSSPDIDPQKLVDALTFSNYNNPDNISNEHVSQLKSGEVNNTELVQSGADILMDFCDSYIRFNLPNAPEEFIDAVSMALSEDSMLAKLAEGYGLQNLIKTEEFPIAMTTLADAFLCVLGVLNKDRAHRLIFNSVIPNILAIPLEDVYPLRNPLPVLTQLYQKQKRAKKVEARLVRKTGEFSSMPCFVVGIYADKELIGEMGGESLNIAIDLAATDALLKLWGISNGRQFLFGDQVKLSEIVACSTPNYCLKDVLEEGTDLSLIPFHELHEEPLKVVDLIEVYKNVIEPEVGVPLRKRLRHKFSRGSLLKRSFRYLIKPKVYTVS
uniref:39S ribosomal protein L44, mitochondrial n=1 Tax=Rhabditophanes sp. KR3021 TaxID=114890 RepID=A0AC35UDC8_9BILA